jgi:hypothetical protein
MNATDFVEVSDLRSLDKVIRKLGIEAIEGMENGVPVLTVTIGRILFMATIHNQCLKLMYRLTSHAPVIATFHVTSAGPLLLHIHRSTPATMPSSSP